MSKILVTGVSGFVGRHLARALHEGGHEVIGTGYGHPPDDDTRGLLTAFLECDLTKSEDVETLPLEDVGAVINLAGLAKVGDSFGSSELYKKVNVGVLTLLGERLLKLKSSARVLAISTGAAYDAAQPMPLTEASKLITDGSPYAASKLLMEDAVQKLRAQGLNCVVVRPFNHSGPGQLPGFIIPDLYQSILGFKQDGRPMRVGNLKARRDYTDVRDIVHAYISLALTKELAFDIYNVCSGKSRSGQEILDLLLAEMGLSGEVKVEVDESLLRPNDPPDLYGDFSRLRQATGWQPAIPFQQTIHDFVTTKS